MRVKRFVSLVTAGVLALSMVPASVQAEENVHTAGYEATDTYVLNYDGIYEGPSYQYLSRYKPYAYWLNSKGTRTAIVFNLYNTCKDEVLPVYCMESGVTAVTNAEYRRLNLEDSIYSEGSAGLIRSVMMNGFPNVSAESIGLAAGVEGLTVSEAIVATQLAVWEASYDELFTVTDFVNTTIEKSWNPTKIDKFDICNEEFIGVDWEARKNDGHSVAEARIEAAYNYLINLEPTEQNDTVVSNTSFTEWSTPQVIKNENGTYNVSVTASVDVEMSDGDTLTLSAVMGDSTYYVSTELDDGINNKTLTIENVPSNIAFGNVILAIDGFQTATDVFMFDAEGNRGSSQTLVGIYNEQLPVHAEIIAEPERVINFWKTTKVPIGENGDGTIAYTPVPLSDITFDIYFVATLDDYLTGTVKLPEKIDMGQFSYSKKKYPSYTVTTDKKGEASVSLTKQNLPDGVYVVAERQNPAIKAPVDPFYIMVPYTNVSGDGWEYELTIEPKNTVVTGPDINKDVIEIEHEDKSGDEEQRFSVDAGEEFTWIIRSGIPVDLADAKEYVITDTLDYRLTYAENLVVKVEESTAEADNSVSDEDVNVLKADIDYVLTVSGGDVVVDEKEEDVKELKIELTAAGMDKVAEIAGEEYTSKEIRVYFNTVIDGDVAPVMGEDIANQAALKYINSVNFRYDTESDIPEVYTCGINLYKHDAKIGAENPEGALSGATFRLAKIVDQDIEGAAPLVTKAGTVYVLYEEFYTAINADGELAAKNDTVTTDAEGKAMLYGLEEGTYYLVETKAPDGYNLLSYPVEVTLNNVSHVTEDDPATEANEDMTVKVANSNQFRLPETGGIGTTIFTASGIMMLAAAAVVLVMKKREEEV